MEERNRKNNQKSFSCHYDLTVYNTHSVKVIKKKRKRKENSFLCYKLANFLVTFIFILLIINK